jgi:hypothetical protein
VSECQPAQQLSATDPLAQRCAGFARAEDLVPAGTAGSTRGFVLAEIPLPWPREVTEHAAVAPVAPALAASGLRLQALVPGATSTPQRRHLVYLTRPPGGFDRYVATPLTVTDAELPDVLERLAAAGAGPPAGEMATSTGTPGAQFPGYPGDRGAAALVAATAGVAPGAVTGAVPIAADDRHVLVCTHGRRDACCGTLGTRLSVSLPGLGAGVHVWRTSHTGGHRFAPTALLLPEGTAWAYLDADTLTAISDRTLDPAIAAGLYRGCTGLDGIEVQAADGEALRRIGWAWLDHRRSGEVIERDGSRTQVTIAGESPGGERRSIAATVEVTRIVPVPDCGKPPERARKSTPELRVTDFTTA